MDLTLVVTAYNDQEFVMDTLESVLTQTVLPSRMGVVMGASRDDTREFVGFYQDELDFFDAVRTVNPVEEGHARLRLKGLQHARGKYVYFLPAGSYLYRDALETMEQYSDETAELLGGAVQVVRSNGSGIRWESPGGLNWEELGPAGPLHPGSILWNRQLLESMKGDLEELRLGPFTTLGWLILAARRHVRAQWILEPILEDWSGIEGPHCWQRAIYDALAALIDLGGPADEDIRSDACGWVQQARANDGGPPARAFLERYGNHPSGTEGSVPFWMEHRVDFPE